MSAIGSGTYVEIENPPTYDDQEMVDFLMDLYMQAKETKGNVRAEWTRNYKITMNRMAPSAPAAPGTRANEVFPTVSTRIGWLTDQEIEFQITPSCDPFNLWSISHEVMSDQLEQILNSVYKSDGWYAEVVKMFWNSAMFGAGFLKCVWDSGLADGIGNVAMKSVSPWCLYVDPLATDLIDANYIIEVHTMSAAEINRRFPEASATDIGEAVDRGETDNDAIPPTQSGGPGNRSGVGNLIPVGSGPTVGPTAFGQQGAAKTHSPDTTQGVVVRECWIKQNFEMERESADPDVGMQTVVVDQWRVIVHAGGRILLDELAENLFHTNRHPYVRYVDEETGEFWGSPILRDLAPCQMSMNQLLAMGQNNIVFTGNPMLIGVKGSGADRATIQNKPGAIFDVNKEPGGQAGGNKPTWLPPPNLPPALMEMVAFWRDEMERIAGLSGANRGEVPSGRATDKQVSAGQEAGFVRIRSAQRQLELTLSKAGELLANLIVINYDTQRYVAIVGPDGSNTAISLAAQHFYAPTQQKGGKVEFAPLRFSLTVNAGSSKPTSRAARIQEANILKQMQVVDDVYVLQAYRVHNWKDVKQRTDKQKAQEAQMLQLAAAAKQGGGKTPSQKANA